MTALAAARNTRALVGSPIPVEVERGAAVDVCYEGGMAAINDAGFLAPAGLAVSDRVIGRFKATVDNSGGSAGDVNAAVEQGAFRWANGDTITASSVGDPCYAGDDQTVYKSDGAGTRPFAGVIVDVDSVGVWVLQGLFVTAGGGSAGGSAASGDIALSIYEAREVTSAGDVGAIAAIGGHLASDTTPILRGDAAESQEISWATGNADLIAFQRTLPRNFDGSADATLELWVYSGTTDAATFTVETSWDGGAVVSDTANDAATKSATVHKITATIAAADIPDAAHRLTLMLTPAAHATNTTQLVAARLLWG